jgi:GAF domain-containing protein
MWMMTTGEVSQGNVSESRRAFAEEAALRLVVEGTASETGTDFFSRAGEKPRGRHGDSRGMGEYLPEDARLRAYAFWLEGQFIENFECAIAGTACAAVVESKTLVHIPDRLIELYPPNPGSLPINAVSYLGVPLLDPHGKVMGHLSVLDDKALPADPRLISLFEIFASRAAAEQRRLRQEMEVRVREEELSALLDSAMDAVVVHRR